MLSVQLSTKRFNNFEIWLWIPSSSKAPLFNVSYKAQNSTQDDTANQFNDAGEVLDNPFIVEDNKGTESLKDITLNTNNNIKNITENRLEANDERKNLDKVDIDNRNTSEKDQNIQIVEKLICVHSR